MRLPFVLARGRRCRHNLYAHVVKVRAGSCGGRQYTAISSQVSGRPMRSGPSNPVGRRGMAPSPSIPAASIPSE